MYARREALNDADIPRVATREKSYDSVKPYRLENVLSLLGHLYSLTWGMMEVFQGPSV